MPSGSAKKFHVFGDQWAGFTMMFHLNQSLSATSSPNFCDFRDDIRMEIFSIIAWLLWNRRNDSHFGKPVHPLHKLCSIAVNTLQEYRTALIKDEDSTPTGPSVL